METLAQFKIRMGVDTIQLLQGSGRKFANLPNGEKLFVGENTDLSKPLFVIKGVHDANWLSNSEAKVVEAI